MPELNPSIVTATQTNSGVNNSSIKKSTGFGIIGGLANGISNLVGSYFSDKRNQEYNEHMYNRQIQDEASQHSRNRQEALEDRDFENWYNSPLQQRIRLEQAGLSPQSFMQSPVETTTQQTAKADVPSSLPFQSSLGSAVGSFMPNVQNTALDSLNALKTLSSVKESMLDSQTKKLYNDWYSDIMSEQLVGMRIANDNKYQNTQLMKQELESKKTLDKQEQLRLGALDYMLEKQKELIRLEVDQKQFDFDHMQQRFDMELKSAIASVSEAYSRNALRSSEASLNNANIGFVNSRTLGQDIDNWIQGESGETLIKKVSAEYNLTKVQAKTAVVNSITQGLIGVSSVVGVGAKILK